MGLQTARETKILVTLGILSGDTEYTSHIVSSLSCLQPQGTHVNIIFLIEYSEGKRALSFLENPRGSSSIFFSMQSDAFLQGLAKNDIKIIAVVSKLC